MAAATTSPHSSNSSPASFYTANASSGDISTSASSPVHGRPSPYRATRQLPIELKQHCQILLEEQLCKLFLETFPPEDKLTSLRYSSDKPLEQHPRRWGNKTTNSHQTCRCPSRKPYRSPEHTRHTPSLYDKSREARAEQRREPVASLSP